MLFSGLLARGDNVWLGLVAPQGMAQSALINLWEKFPRKESLFLSICEDKNNG